MWADLVLRAERQHAAELLAWAALSLIMATASLVLTRARRERSPILGGFAVQLALWSFVIGAVAVVEWYQLAIRDLSGATRLERLTYARAGLDVGIVACGAVLAGASRVLGRSSRGMGAAAAIATHGVALLVIDLRLIAAISR